MLVIGSREIIVKILEIFIGKVINIFFVDDFIIWLVVFNSDVI